MAPKKSTKASKPASKKASPGKEQAKPASSGNADGANKRKREPSPPSSSERSTKLLNFLLKDAASRFASQDANQPNLFDHMSDSASYTPFQNLMACVTMSKPISSRLGVRTLRTIFSKEEGLDFTTPEKVKDAGEDGRYEALSKAKTQHKDKTSLQYGRLAERVLEKYSAEEGDVSLSKLRDEAGNNPESIAKLVKDFYGFGGTAVEVFSRRMQKDWKELYPYADERTLNAAAHLGLAHDSSESLAKQVDELLQSKDDDEKRANFTTIVDALVACDLEHKYDELEKILDSEESGNGAAKEDGSEEPQAKAAKKD